MILEQIIIEFKNALNALPLWIIGGGHSYLFWINLKNNKLHFSFELNVYFHQNDTELILVISIDASEKQHCTFKYI